MRKYITAILVSILSALFLVSGISAQDGKTGKRRVLILDFIDTGGGSRISFLEKSGPDVVNQELLQSGQYQLVPREVGLEALEKLKLSGERILKKANIIKIGDMTQVDVIISGEYSVERKQVLVKLTSHGMTSDVKEDLVTDIKSPFSNAVFAQVQKVALRHINRMEKAMPPFSEEKVERKKQVVVFKKSPFLSIMLNFGMDTGLGVDDLGNFVTGTNSGVGVAGFRAQWTPPPKFRFFYPVFEADFVRVFGTNSPIPQYVYAYRLGFGAPLQITSRMIFSPQLVSGYMQTYELMQMIESGPTVRAGFNIKYFFSERLALVIDPSVFLFFESGVRFWVNPTVGMAYRF